MTSSYVLFGNWKIRHDEPVTAAEDALRLHAAPPQARGDRHSIVLDLRGRRRVDALVVSGRLSQLTGGAAPIVECKNLAADPLPLAIVQLDGDRILPTHLLTRVERHKTHFVRPPIPAATCDARGIVQALREAFEVNHIFLNNFECHFLNHLPGMALARRVSLAADSDCCRWARAWYSALDDGSIDGFMPQLGDEIRDWNYDAEHFDVAPTAEVPASYVSLMHWSQKRKSRWDEPVATFRRVWETRAVLFRQETHVNQPGAGPAAGPALAAFFKAPVMPLSSCRETRFEVSCESVSTGNIFSVGFQYTGHCDPPDRRAAEPVCEVRYVKTRGAGSEAVIVEELGRLARAVEAFARHQGAAATPPGTPRSKGIAEHLTRRE
jgi:hypothetical protein